ncbi:MAG: type III pantothenate kinase [Chitinophagaceae bacterium]
MTTLCLDFGNTRKKCAVFINNNIADIVVFNDDIMADLEKILIKYNPAKSILSSVINHSIAIEEILSKNTQFHKLNYQSKLPITTPVGKPETIGADRLAICSAAVAMFPKQHNLAIGLGSCITYNFINKFGEFLGGSISPGMQMRFKAMNDYTALLPIVKAEHQFPLVGYDTKTNLLSGVLYGLAKELDGIIDMYKEKYDKLNVIVTGGDAAFFSKHLNNKINFEPELIFKGLLAISNAN